MLVWTRKELGFKGFVICVLLGLGLLAGFVFFEPARMYCVIGQVLLDVVLILILFGGDIRIN